MSDKVSEIFPKDRPAIFLAPMAGFTDLAQRILSRNSGADAMWTEMVNARSILEGNQRGLALLTTEARDVPLVVQLFGADAERLAEAACWVVDNIAPAAIDLNFGCPVKKVARNGAGAILMQTPERIAEIVRVVRRAYSGFLSIKIRKGWGSTTVTAPWIVERAEDWGTDAIMIHPRLATQFYGGEPDWTVVTQCRALTKLPLVGSGNIVDGASAHLVLEQTGCDGLAIGRAAIGDPGIFARVKAAIAGEGEPKAPSPSEAVLLAKRHFELVLELTDAKPKVCFAQRKTLVKYLHGFSGASLARRAIMEIDDNEALLNYFDDFAQYLLRAEQASHVEDDPVLST